ncbi:MAG: EAL domain-containing protein [Patescibacteria group bacterium]
MYSKPYYIDKDRFDIKVVADLQQSARRVQQMRYLEMLEFSLEPMFIQVEGRIVLINQSGVDFFEAANPDQLLGKQVLDLLDPSYKELVKQRIAKLNTDQESVAELEEVWITVNGQPKEAKVKAVPFEYLSKNGALVVMKDISHEKKLEREIRERDNIDSLTGLPNHRGLMNYLDLLFRSRTEFNFVLISIRERESLQRNLGKHVLDETLRSVAFRLQERFPRSFMARLENEFALVKLTATEDSFKTTNKILTCFGQPFEMDYGQIELSCNLALTTGHIETDSNQAYRNAETALRLSKSKGKNQVVVYDPELNMDDSDAETSVEALEKDLFQALVQQQMRVYLQPIAQSDSRKIVGAEALIRWHHPKLGLLTPARFLTLAQELNLLVDIDRWVLKQVCKMLTSVEFEDIKYISVNMSSEHFSDLVNHQRTLQQLSVCGLDCSRLKLEITETSLVGEYEIVSESIRRMAELGVKISVDDFGTGYSSLSYLNNLKLDCLKIDQSFVSNIEFNEISQVITKNIISLAKDLKLETTAEGVETERQLESVKDWGCDLIQGYFIGKPLPVSEFLQLMNKA